MKLVIQRVNWGKVVIDGRTAGAIEKGYVVFLGIGEGDNREMVDKYVDKLYKLRIFADAQGKTNCSIQDVGGALLVISQFTLYADCRKGNRPSFTKAAPPAVGETLYHYFLERSQGYFQQVEHGEFGADMKVSLENDGPFTIVWDSSEW